MKQACHKGCYHCPGGPALKHRLFDDEYFWITCDCHPLTKGHILIISKEHISCMGALSNDSFGRFKELYAKVLNFLNKTSGPAAVFEHGILGQTVPHAHVHFLPFSKPLNDVIPEKAMVKKISTLDEIKTEFKKNHKYLFVAINNEKWLVGTKIGCPAFFRDRFSKALGTAERGDWKKSESSAELMKVFDQDIRQLKDKWGLFFSEQG